MDNVKLKRLDSGKPSNSSFMTPKNMTWFNFILQAWIPDPGKPLVFLPCGMANKTRGPDGRKFISNGMGHQLMSAITKEESFERVIISEPLTVIPYSLEKHPLRPDYNLPVEELSIQSEQIFIRQLALVLLMVRMEQPNRQHVYYCGPRHHYFILKEANEKARKPFRVIFKIPRNGIKDYASASKDFKTEILECECTGREPVLEEPDLGDFLKSRNSYTTKKFWHYITLKQRKGTHYESDIEEVTKKSEAIHGFVGLYVPSLS